MGGGMFLLVVILLVVVGLVAYIPWAFRGKASREAEGRSAMLQDIAAETGAWEKPRSSSTTTGAAAEAAGQAVPEEPGGPQRACPHCGEQFDATLAACPACGRPSEPWFERDGEWFTKAERGQVFRWDAATGRWVLA